LFLGQGPGKTSSVVETKSVVDEILKEKSVQYINVSLFPNFEESEEQTEERRKFLHEGLQFAVNLYLEGKLKPKLGKIIKGDLDEINAELIAMQEGRSTPSKIAVRLLEV